MKCPHCNETDHEPTAKFCHVCGNSLETKKPPEPNPMKGILVVLVVLSVLFGFFHWLSNRPRPVDSPPQEKKIAMDVGKIKIAIDLGLPSGTKWANCNVGATQPWEYGGHYAWGETEEKDEYWARNYKHYSSFLWGIISFYHDLGDNICGTEYDVARVKWGGKWQMPTSEQIEELLKICKCEWTTLNGVTGCKFTGPNNNYIFLPAAERCVAQWIYTDDGDYWSGSLDFDGFAWCLSFYKDGEFRNSLSRNYGLSVRPVVTK